MDLSELGFPEPMKAEMCYVTTALTKQGNVSEINLSVGLRVHF